MTMTEKCVYQKLYEKLRMAQLYQVRVMVATNEGQPGLYLCATGLDGVVPIARLLTHEELDQVTPDFEKSDLIHEFFETMEIVDPRDEDSELNDWDALVGFGFEEAFMTGVDDLSKPSTGDER
jgi:hypothetical protein